MALSQRITKLEKQNQGLFNEQLIAQRPPGLRERWSPLQFDCIAYIKDNFVCLFQLADLPFISDLSFKNLVKAVENNNDADAKKEKRAARCALPFHVIEHDNVKFIIPLSENLFATISSKEAKIWHIKSTKHIEFIKRFELFRLGDIRNVITNSDGTYLYGLRSTLNSEEFWALNLTTGVVTTKHFPYPINGNNQLVCLSDNSFAVVGERNSKITKYYLHIQLCFLNETLTIEIDARTFSDKKIKQLFITPDKQFWIILDANNRLSLWLPPTTNGMPVKLFECQLNPKIKIEILPNGSLAILHNNGMLHIFNPYKANENLIFLINNVNDFLVMPSGKLLVFKNNHQISQLVLQSVTNYLKYTKDTLLKLFMDTIPTLPKVLVLLTLEYNQATHYSPQEALWIPRSLSEPLQYKMMGLFYHAQTCPEAKAATEYLCAGLNSKTDPATWANSTTRLFQTRRGALTAPLREMLTAVAELKR